MLLCKLADLLSFDTQFAACPQMLAGIDFLRSADLAALPDGRHDIDGDRLFAVVARGLGRGQSDSPLEVHREYADIQYIVSGIDLIGWRPLTECKNWSSDFDAARDLGFFKERPRFWMPVHAGELAVFLPEDAHAPLGGSGPVHKIVVKVRLK